MAWTCLLHSILHRGHGRDGQLGIGSSWREGPNDKEKVKVGTDGLGMLQLWPW